MGINKKIKINDITISTEDFKTYDAIVAIGRYGAAIIMRFLTEEHWTPEEHWKIEAQNDFDSLAEYEFSEDPGIYFANCYGVYCNGPICNCE